MFQSIKSKIYIIITLTTLIFTITIFFLMSEFYSINVKNTNEICNHKMEYYSSRINSIINKLSNFITDFAIKGDLFFNLSNRSHKDLDTFVYNTLYKNNNDIIFGGGVFFEPYVIEKNNKYFYSHVFSSIKNTNIEKNSLIFNKTYGKKNNYFNRMWYTSLKKSITSNHRFSFTKPYISNFAKDIPVITIGSGIFDKNNKLVGIAVGDCSLTSIISQIRRIYFTENTFILFADKKNDTILVSTYNNDYYKYIGKSLKALRWYNENLKNGDTFILKNVKYISFSKRLLNNMALYVNIPTNELYSDTVTIFKYTIFFMIIIVFIIFFIMKSLLYSNIEKPINYIIEKIKLLSRGNLDIKFDIEYPKEFNVISNSFNNTINNLKNNIHKEKIYENDLRIASTIQSSTLLKIFPPYIDRNEFDIHASMIPAKQVGGDFYDFFFLNDKNFIFLIADVSDKGVPAALFMMRAKSVLKNSIQTTNTLKQAIEKANKILCSSNTSSYFVTVFVAMLNTDTGVLKYINAGHNSPLIKENGIYKYLSVEKNMSLGINENKNYIEQESILKKQDAIFLYTDGITESQNSKKEFYGESKLQETLNKKTYSSAKEIIDEVNKDISNFNNSKNQYDDMTMLSLIYNGLDANTICIKANIEMWSKLYKFLLYDMTYKAISKEIRSKVLLASEEIFTNIAKYAYKVKTGSAWIKTEKTDNTYKITFSDYGKQYNPLEQATPTTIHSSVKERKIGGLGIFLVRNIVNKIEYIHEYSQNKISITFNL